MSHASDQKSRITKYKNSMIIIGVLVCLLSMISITRLQSTTSPPKTTAGDKNIIECSNTDHNTSTTMQVQEKSSKPHYNFLTYYFMVESNRKKDSESSAKEESNAIQRFATIPKLLFNNLFSQN